MGESIVCQGLDGVHQGAQMRHFFRKGQRLFHVEVGRQESFLSFFTRSVDLRQEQSLLGGFPGDFRAMAGEDMRVLSEGGVEN